MLELKLLTLIVIANGSPIVASKVLGKRWQLPLDAGKLFIDRKPLFGEAKTWRGIFASCFLTIIAAWIFQLYMMTGLLIALCAMLGDLLSSFIKRRLGMSPSTRALGLDQIPESLLPMLMVKSFASALLPPILQGDMTWALVWEVIVMFFVAGLLLSKMLYYLHIRNKPY